MIAADFKSLATIAVQGLKSLATIMRPTGRMNARHDRRDAHEWPTTPIALDWG